MLHRVLRYSTLPVHYQEDVAQHSWYVSFYALVIYELIREFDPDCEIDKGTLLERAIVHDLDEMISGDVHRPFKYADKDMKDSMTKVALRLLLKWQTEAQLPSTVYHSAVDAKSGIEGEIIRLSDMLSVASFTIENHKMGNTFVIEVAENVVKALTEFVESSNITHPVLTEIARSVRVEMNRII